MQKRRHSGYAVSFFGVVPQPISQIRPKVRRPNGFGHDFRNSKLRVVRDLFKIIVLGASFFFTFGVGFGQLTLLALHFPLLQQFFSLSDGQRFRIGFSGLKLISRRQLFRRGRLHFGQSGLLLALPFALLSGKPLADSGIKFGLCELSFIRRLFLLLDYFRR